MIRRQRPFLMAGVALGDALLLAAAWVLAYVLRFELEAAIL